MGVLMGSVWRMCYCIYVIPIPMYIISVYCLFGLLMLCKAMGQHFRYFYDL